MLKVNYNIKQLIDNNKISDNKMYPVINNIKDILLKADDIIMAVENNPSVDKIYILEDVFQPTKNNNNFDVLFNDNVISTCLYLIYNSMLNDIKELLDNNINDDDKITKLCHIYYNFNKSNKHKKNIIIKSVLEDLRLLINNDKMNCKDKVNKLHKLYYCYHKYSNQIKYYIEPESYNIWSIESKILPLSDSLKKALRDHHGDVCISIQCLYKLLTDINFTLHRHYAKL